ncbi:helix-turn-helix domain-containing protein [Streptomyces alboniger]|uniref:XRE family transcriptional regulator n=1 Tax=Streptomyces alboniger TaxID=132473 RepID=A0A5J6HJU6_STRAD|nr:helix-turn-helix transcriptional regulator [Streptomyces alboniger]QEV18650.1 XRE family transcriptional regulator [Streptomyces alboniger]
MPTSPSSSAQAAREAVAWRLRELRKEAGLTVVQLAAECGWHYSKTSRIENALTGPSATDIRRWCAAVHAESQAHDLVVQSINAESMYRQWRDQVRSGLRYIQESRSRFFRETGNFRMYSSSLVPGLLQTEGYALAVLGLAAEIHHLPVDDSAEAARVRLERSRIIHEQGHRFVVVVEESVLYCQIVGPDAMAAQLGYLLTVGAMPAVSLGVIPMSARRSHWPEETFHVYDDRLVSVELVSAEVNVTQPGEVAQYLETFERLRRMAVYGAEARSLIAQALNAVDHADT